MQDPIVSAFVEAAQEVLLAETALSVTYRAAELSDRVYVTDEVTVIISLVGDINGTVLYSLSEALALKLAGHMLGEPLAAGLDALAQSGIAELGNVITGQASIKLSQAGYEVKISPPTLLLGPGTSVSTLDLPRLVIPLTGADEAIGLHLALRDANFEGGAARVAALSRSD
jgi:chemotaxis protein CheX